METKYEYYIQKQSIQSPQIAEGGYDEDETDHVAVLNSMGALGWELCGIINHPSVSNDPANAKFVYKRELPPKT